MATVKSLALRCPTCRGKSLIPADLVGVECFKGLRHYRMTFPCPHCETDVERWLTSDDFSRLACVRKLITWTMHEVPLEAREPRPDLGPMSLDDLIDLHFDLLKTDLLAGVALAEVEAVSL
jgi:hypothetical protein